MMVPAGDITGGTVDALVKLLSPGDTIVDGGNSNYKNTLDRAKAVSDKGLHSVASGTSGWRWRRGRRTAGAATSATTATTPAWTAPAHRPREGNGTNAS